jgi:cellulose synthase/poly-beta-1,6-N-acetylglucosamine synthase-like glycosyltransferase
MYVLMLLTMLLLTLYVVPAPWQLIKHQDAFLDQLALSVFFLIIILFCLFGVYYSFLYLFYLIGKIAPSLERSTFVVPPAVAILYLVKNDFRKQAAMACFSQKYPRFHTFILDDSTNDVQVELIDHFEKEHPDATVIRRPKAQGFKAGNLNYALLNIPEDFEYIAIIDSDEIMPDNFLETCMSYFPANPNLAFVQAQHRSYREEKTLFARDVALINDIHWKYLVSPKNKYGFTMFYGHGAVFKRQCLKSVGGFPEIVSEDLAVSALLRKKGYYGYTSADVICYEETPQTYIQYRKRQEKWVRGTAEFIKKHLWGILTSCQVSWYEKLDIIIGNLCLFMPVFLFLLLCLGGIVLPLMFTSETKIYFSLPFVSMGFHYHYFGIENQFVQVWTWRFFVPILLSIVIHYVPVLWEYRRAPWKIFRHLKTSFVVSSGLTLFGFIGFIGGLLSKTVFFATTGDRLDQPKHGGWVNGYISDRTSTFLLELAFGAVLIFSAALTFNIWLLPSGTAFLLSYLIYRYHWNNSWIQRIIGVPFLFLVLVLAIMLLGFIKL